MVSHSPNRLTLRIRTLLAGLLLIAVIANLGCALFRRGLPEVEGLLSPEEIRERLAAHAEGWQTFTANAGFRLTAPEIKGTQSFRGFIIYAKPDKFRLQSHTILGLGAFDFLVRGDQFWFYYPRERILVTEQDADRLSFLPMAVVEEEGGELSVQPSEVLRTLFLVDTDLLETRRVRREGKLVSFESPERNRPYTRVTIVNAATGAIQEIQWYEGRRPAPDGLIGRAKFEEYRLLSDIPFAHRVTMEDLRAESRLQIKLDKVQLNAELPERLFEFSLPR